MNKQYPLMYICPCCGSAIVYETLKGETINLVLTPNNEIDITCKKCGRKATLKLYIPENNKTE